jgi:hypothetical protein
MNGKNRGEKKPPPWPVQWNLLCPKAMYKKNFKKGEKLQKEIRKT